MATAETATETYYTVVLEIGDTRLYSDPHVSKPAAGRERETLLETVPADDAAIIPHTGSVGEVRGCE